MTSLAKRKKQLLSIVLCFSLVMTGMTVGKKTAKAAEYPMSTFSPVFDGMYQSYYYDNNNGTKVFQGGDTITGNPFNFFQEGDEVQSNVSSVTIPKGDWLVYDIYASVGYVGNVKITSATATPKVYLSTSESDAEGEQFEELQLGTADENGMAPATFPANSQASDSVKAFYDGLNIKVTKNVDKLDKASFRISITDKAGNDRTSLFNFYGEEDLSLDWQDYDTYCINGGDLYQGKALGGILSDDVKVYIKPYKNLLRVKTSVDGAGGTITPEDCYTNYDEYSSGGLAYTVEESEDYEFDSIKTYQNGTKTGSYNTSNFDENILNKIIFKDNTNNDPFDFSSFTKQYNIGEVKASFVKAFYDVCLTRGDNGQIYKYDCSGGYEACVTDENNPIREQVHRGSNSEVYYIKANDADKYKVVLKDNNDIQDLGTANSDGYYKYQVKSIDADHGITVDFNETTISNKNYPAEFVYTGNSITAPAKDNFSVNSDSNDVTFTWYQGNYKDSEVVESDKLASAPSEIGTYTLKVDVGETASYPAASKKFIVEIKKSGAKAEATLAGTNKGSDGWYSGDVTITAPEGYEISASKEEDSFTDSLKVTEDMEGDYTYYLKEKDTGYIIGPNTIVIKRDTTKPTGTVTTKYNSRDGFVKGALHYFIKNSAAVTVTANDGGTVASGVKKVEYLLAGTSYDNQEAFLAANANKNGWKALTKDANGRYKFNIPAKFKGFAYVRITDTAGNVTVLNTDGVVVYSDAAQSTKKVTYVKNTKKNTVANVTLNGNTVKTVTISKAGTSNGTALKAGTQYSVNASKNQITWKGTYLETLPVGNYTITLSYNPQGVAYAPNYSAKAEDAPKTTTIALVVEKAAAYKISAAQYRKNSVILTTGAKLKWKNGKITLSWTAIKDADGYDIYANLCGKRMNAKALAMSVDGKKTNATLTKIVEKKIFNKEEYKLRICAYKMVDGKKVYIGKSQSFHMAGKKSPKYTNAKKVRAKLDSVTLKTGKTKKMNAKITKESKNKKLLSRAHGPSLQYYSSDTDVATVTAKGKIKAVGKGSCTVYAVALNGKKVKVKVTVK